jgi:hypothetical protein
MYTISLAPDELERRVSFDPRDDDVEPSAFDEAALQAWLDEASARPDWSTAIAPLLDRLPAVEADTVELVPRWTPSSLRHRPVTFRSRTRWQLRTARATRLGTTDRDLTRLSLRTP